MTNDWDMQPGPVPPTGATATVPAPPHADEPFFPQSTTAHRSEWPYSAPTPPPSPPSSSSPPPTRHGGGWRVVLASLGVAGLLAAGYGVGTLVSDNDQAANGTRSQVATPISQTQNGPTTPKVDNDTDEPVAAVAKALGPAVVQIEVKTNSEQGLGSGLSLIHI